MAGGKVPIAAGRAPEDLERELLARAREILGS
jgi:hypothetical protein